MPENLNNDEDLMHDPRIRAVIKEQLYKDLLLGPVVVTLVCLFTWYEFVKWPDTKLLVAVLLVWWFNSLLLLYIYLYHRNQDFDSRNSPDQSSRYLKLLHINLSIDKLGLGIAAMLMYETKQEWGLPVVSGLMMYLYGTFFKNIAYAKVAQFFPTLMLLPLAIDMLYKGGLYHNMLAFYFLLNALVLSKYARSIAAAIQLPIKQRLELEELTGKLKLERERADAANAAKSHFFTAASHDARQPLQVISLLFQSLQKSIHMKDQDKLTIDKIDVNLNTIRSLFDRVLDISRIDSGNVIPHMQAVQLQPLFDKFDAQFGELAASKGLWLRFVPTEAWVKQDPELLDRILSNLVHNAIKYTPTGGVWVAWRAARGRIEVRDTGLGISAKHQLTIFDEFAQINNPARNNEAGLGLGLSIVKRLADLTQTPIGLVSKLDHGSTFWLRLSKVDTAITKIPNTVDNINNINANIINTPLANLHLLYAEDEPQIRELFSNLLEAAGAVVYVCADVNDAKKYIDNQPLIDLVLTDYRLGESGTGVDIVQYARNQYQITNIKDNDKVNGYNTLPAIILTGDTAVKDLQSIQQLPNCTLLHKPLDFDRLVVAVQAVSTRKQ